MCIYTYETVGRCGRRTPDSESSPRRSNIPIQWENLKEARKRPESYRGVMGSRGCIYTIAFFPVQFSGIEALEA